jgi:hypothetical protein
MGPRSTVGQSGLLCDVHFHDQQTYRSAIVLPRHSTVRP